ncbi:uncharacterized protein LOC114296862 [Camellia sinensis]|uniref:uncharacterized protein LOC114296862 n=1 Tax=Camellia sinensis TaxID=4442 RepID=UPI001036BEBF|nr:uncharacterized protein LOC114296862 [Camellia sinensis]
MASDNNYAQPAIPCIDGYYEHWSMLMDNFLRSKEYWTIVETGVVEPASSARVKRQQLQALHKDFETLHMKEGELIYGYFARTVMITNKMHIHGDNLEDVVVEKILWSMSPKFAYVVWSIEESKDIDVFSIDELQSSLLVHEYRVATPSTEEQALKVSTHIDSPTGRGLGQGHGKGRGRGRGRGKGTNFRGRGRGRCRDKGEKSNFAEKEEEKTLLMAYHHQEDAHSNKWYLDSDCSNHMCGNKSLFSNLDESFKDIVKLGNNSRMTVMGKGTIRLQVKDHFFKIPGVFHVPDLKSNLISMGQLQERGYTIIIRKGYCSI